MGLEPLLLDLLEKPQRIEMIVIKMGDLLGEKQWSSNCPPPKSHTQINGIAIGGVASVSLPVIGGSGLLGGP